MLRTGRVRAIAVASDKRIAALPEVPTLAEIGIQDMVVTQWWGYVAPARVPGAIQERLHKDHVAAIDDASVRERVSEFAVDASTSTCVLEGAHRGRVLRRWAVVCAQRARLKARVGWAPWKGGFTWLELAVSV